MAHRICPSWVGYLLISPLRRLVENPVRIFGPFVQQGMVVLEPGCGMGYFTLPLARRVGSDGRVVAIDIQPRMLSVLKRRAERAGLSRIIEIRKATAERLGIEDLRGRVDLATALHMVHEVPDPASFFAEVRGSLKPSGRLLLLEPAHHVSKKEFEGILAIARESGFCVEDRDRPSTGRKALLRRNDAR